MALRKKRPDGNPRISSVKVVEGRQAGKPAKSVVAGTVLRIDGTNFGARWRGVRAHFDQIDVPVYPVPFSSTRVTVTAPLPPASTSSLHVTVRGRASNKVELRVTRPPRAGGAPGGVTIEFMRTLDQYAALTAATARGFTGTGAFPNEFRQASDALSGSRIVLQRSMELLLTWRELQNALPFEAMETLKNLDDVVSMGGFTELVQRHIDSAYGDKGVLGSLLGQAVEAGVTSVTTVGEFIFDAASGVWQFIRRNASLIGTVIHEGSKALEGIENFTKISSPSLSAEVVVGVDVSFNFGEAISGIAKFIDIVGQTLIAIGDADAQAALLVLIQQIQAGVERNRQGIQQLETKADRAAGEFDAFRAQVFERLSRQDTALAALEAKADQLAVQFAVFRGETLSRFERVDTQLQTLEAKADRAETKLDSLAAKVNEIDRKIDEILQRLNRVQQSLDDIRQTLARIENIVRDVQVKVNAIQNTVNAIQATVNAIQATVNAIQTTVTNIGRGLGDLDRKLEDRLDAVDTAIADAQRKLDRLETKIDQLP